MRFFTKKYGPHGIGVTIAHKPRRNVCGSKNRHWQSRKGERQVARCADSAGNQQPGLSVWQSPAVCGSKMQHVPPAADNKILPLHKGLAAAKGSYTFAACTIKLPKIAPRAKSCQIPHAKPLPLKRRAEMPCQQSLPRLPRLPPLRTGSLQRLRPQSKSLPLRPAQASPVIRTLSMC